MSSAGKRECDTSAAIGGGIHDERAAMSAGDGFGDAEAQAAAFDLGAVGDVATEKALKQMFLVFF